MDGVHMLSELGDIRGKRVLVRLDFNVPVSVENVVVDDYRIRKSLPTINYLREKGAKVIMISHIEGETDSLKAVYAYLKKAFPEGIEFCEDCVEGGAACIEAMEPGSLLLCENIRLYDGEKKNDAAFAKKLADLGDIYVNDAFSVSHRSHASVSAIATFLPSYMGLQFEQEIKHLSTCFNPEHPFLFILAGAKFETKMPLVEKFLSLADTVFIGGALANDIFKAQGKEVGASRVSDSSLDLSAIAQHDRIMLPQDVAVALVTQDASAQVIKTPDELETAEAIYDAGPATVEALKKKITEAQMILWNGPLGNYEKGFKQPTLDLAQAIADRKKADSSVVTVVGGGDTLAAIAELGLEDKFTFVSTGGGAMLDYLSSGTLPGLEALKNGK